MKIKRIGERKHKNREKITHLRVSSRILRFYRPIILSNVHSFVKNKIRVVMSTSGYFGFIFFYSLQIV